MGACQPCRNLQDPLPQDSQMIIEPSKKRELESVKIHVQNRHNIFNEVSFREEEKEKNAEEKQQHLQLSQTGKSSHLPQIQTLQSKANSYEMLYSPQGYTAQPFSTINKPTIQVLITFPDNQQHTFSTSINANANDVKSHICKNYKPNLHPGQINLSFQEQILNPQENLTQISKIYPLKLKVQLIQINNQDPREPQKQQIPKQALLTSQRPLPQKRVQLHFIDSSKKTLLLSKTLTIRQLTHLIFKDHFHELKPEQMVLLLNQKALSPQSTIGSISFENKIVLQQKKAELWEIPTLTADQHKIGQENQKGCAKLTCGCWVGRKTMRKTVENQVNNFKSSIKCPFKKQNGNNCNFGWQTNQWMLVAGYTQTETSQIQEKLSQNVLKTKTKNCPNCKNAILHLGSISSKIKCPKCKTDFCLRCLHSWTSNQSCSSDECNSIRDNLLHSPATKAFHLRTKDTNKEITVRTPQIRACPRCLNIVENTQNCKYTRCICMEMNYSFCFVCLSLFNNNVWPCGSANNHCGKVAPNQTLP